MSAVDVAATCTAGSVNWTDVLQGLGTAIGALLTFAALVATMRVARREHRTALESIEEKQRQTGPATT